MGKNLFAALAFTGLAIGSASAADLLSPAPLGQGWAGFYAGASLGGAWLDDTTDNAVASTVCNEAITPCDPIIAALRAAVPRVFDTEASGFTGGGQVGYNWQSGPFIWGTEADFLGTDLKGSQRAADTVALAFPGDFSITVDGVGIQKLDFLGTLRGRLGWIPVPPLLIYATGGLAYGHVELDAQFFQRVNNCGAGCGPFPTVRASREDWRSGWTVGGGAEWLFAPRWSLRGQYLFYDLGESRLRQTIVQINGMEEFVYSADIASTAQFTGSIATIGLNYGF